jgi:ABC-2 type transport system permease protein
VVTRQDDHQVRGHRRLTLGIELERVGVVELVARQEELQFVTIPIALPLIIGYVLVYAAIASPDASWLKVASFLPPLTATLMPARIALGHVAWWELPLAAAIMGASIYAMIRIASNVYTRSLRRAD